ncbi:hypothetical protein RJ640_023162 [Escallonia rubra]|uniref:Uncharacterized protein n=1 Tax=Escallonia rubra TaxID=112253 RepID=A0AA88R711_9ASTE|nr:hypothetical protein RJ640_023162 [Escallonia rubra]
MVAEERAGVGMDLSGWGRVAELVEVAEELEDVGAAAAGEGERRPVVAQKQGMVKEGEQVALVQSGRQPIWRFQSTHNIHVRKESPLASTTFADAQMAFDEPKGKRD